MSCCSAQNKTRVECWPARQWGKLTVRPGTQPDFLEMQSFTRSEWRPRKSARGLEREADARINLSAALEVAAEVSRMIGHTYTTWTSGYAFGFSCYSGRHAALNAVEKMDL